MAAASSLSGLRGSSRRARGSILVVQSLLLASAWTGRAEDVAVFSTSDVGPYREAIDGAKAALRGVTILETAVAEDMDLGRLDRRLARAGVKVLMAIGSGAANVAARLPGERPIIVCMIIDASELPSSRRLAGVHLQVMARDQLVAFSRLVPKVRKVAILYDPAHTSDRVDEATAAAAEIGIEVLPLEIRSPRDIFPALRSIRDRGGDSLWMVLDPTVYNRDSMQGILRFTVEQHIPFMASDREIVRSGALCALAPRFEAIGRQAAAMVRSLLAGGAIDDLPLVGPADSGLYVNLKTAALIGAALDRSAISEATEQFR